MPEVVLGCWVAPSIAAEFWGMSLGDVLSMIRSGLLPTHDSGGFSFVRLPLLSSPGTSLPRTQRPSTFNIVPAGDLGFSGDGMGDGSSIVSDASTSGSSEPSTAPDGLATALGEDDESELGPPPDEDPDDNRIADWRSGRRASAARRQPPGKASHGAA